MGGDAWGNRGKLRRPPTATGGISWWGHANQCRESGEMQTEYWECIDIDDETLMKCYAQDKRVQQSDSDNLFNLIYTEYKRGLAS